MAYPLASDIIRRARALLQDSDTPFRYSDVDLLDAINDGVQRCVSLRPDYFLDVSFAPVPAATTAADVQIQDALIFPVLMFAVGNMYLREDEFQNDGRASALVKDLEARIAGRPT